jgi:hypothetical protein
MQSHCEWTIADWNFLSMLEQRARTLTDAGAVASALRAVSPKVPFQHASFWSHLLLLTTARVFDYRPLRVRLAVELRQRGESPTSVLRLLHDAAVLGKKPAWSAVALRREIRVHGLRSDLVCGSQAPRFFDIDTSRIRRMA